MHLQCDTSHPQLKRSASGESHGSQTSSASSNKTLLFGEIPTSLSPVSDELKSYRSNESICSLVMSTNASFQRFWMNEKTRNNFLGFVPQEDLCNLRLVCHDISTRTAPFLFEELSVTFTAKTFTKPARIRALDKIGRHVRTLTFHMPHGDSTFLPPLINVENGTEELYHYEPQIQHDPRAPRYGTLEMTELLIRQYPPLFHAATNVPSFVRALSTMPSLKHLKVSCPGQEPFYRYRRDIVDYALISLRIAVERAPLQDLDTLSFLPIHPAGLSYLQPGVGFGASPSATRRWAQIRKLAIHMDSFSIDRTTQTDHLRILHSYLRFFSPRVQRLLFRWRDARGPSPFSLDREPCMQLPLNATVGQNQAGHVRALKFPKLQYMELENAVMDASQISTFINRHRKVLAEFNFEDVHLRTGTWDDALAPLSRIAGNDDWRRKQEEFMDVPIVFSPVDEEPRILGPLHEEQVERSRSGIALTRWLSRSKSDATAKKAKEHFWGSSDHMKKFLRSPLFTWR